MRNHSCLQGIDVFFQADLTRIKRSESHLYLLLVLHYYTAVNCRTEIGSPFNHENILLLYRLIYTERQSGPGVTHVTAYGIANL